MMIKRAGLALLIAASASGVANAQSYPFSSLGHGPGPYPPPVQIEQSGPAAVLKEGLSKLLAFAGQKGRPGMDVIVPFLEREIAPYFDFTYMAQWAGGRSWRHLGEDRRLELEQRIKVDFLSTLASRLAGFEGQQVRILRSRRMAENEANVTVGVLNPGSYPSQLEFRFYLAPGGWKVFDVSANGSSAVMHYRTEFNRMMRYRAGQRGGYPPVRQ